MRMIATLYVTFLILLAGCENEPMPEEPPIETPSTSRCDQLFPPADTVIATHTAFTKTNYLARIKVFQADTISEGDIVMLGNSLTEQGGNWNVKLEEVIVKNRGISGDNTDGVLARLNELICKKPSVVFIMIGTNDLFISYSADKVAQNIHSIGTLLSEELPSAKIIVQTIMPLAEGNSAKTKLLAINEQLEGIEDAPYELLDTFAHMSNESGDLPSEFTTDGVHLTAAGYTSWSSLLKSNLDTE